MSKRDIELLAPAGSIETFHAAIDAGADAIYLGFGDFNARLRNKNFTAKTLSYLIPHAQDLGKKVYVAMNTLVKDGEIPAFVNNCNQVRQLKPDAVIVQDLGMAAMMKRYFPQIELHGSTQMAIHNTAGLKAAEELGVTRVVPARELTLREIYKLKNKTKLEMELFIHGALCYSVSGNCLASSFIGGASGNRGKCTQVCRRKFSEGHRSGFYFSPKDFQALDFIEQYRTIGITSLKIEGRMKSSSYIYNVTSAYRDYLDGNADYAETVERLKFDYGRDKCTFMLNGEESVGVVSAGKVPGTGLFAGNIISRMGQEFIVEKGTFEMSVGDRVRFQPEDGKEGWPCKVQSVSIEAGMARVGLSNMENKNSNGSLFIISRDSKQAKRWKKASVTVPPRKLGKNIAVTGGKVMSALDHEISKHKDRLFLRFDHPDWFKVMTKKRDARIILNLHEEWVESFSFAQHKKNIGNNAIMALPLFIPEGKLGFWKEVVTRLKKEGVSNWMVGQFGLKTLFGKSDTLYADYTVWAMNRYTEKMLLESGYSYFSYSPEDDILNLKRIGSDRGLMPVYMRIPLFISRINSPIQNGRVVMDDENGKYFADKKDGLANLISDEPLSLIHRTKKLNELGICNFVIDLSYYKPDAKMFRTLMIHWDRKERVPGSLFNHKRGLK